MSSSPYCIGIDLGTSNCAVAYVDMGSDVCTTQVLKIPQYSTLSTVAESDTLPSFLYLATADESALLETSADTVHGSVRHVLGNYAREQALVHSERVIHSAKSWLCHPDVDRTAAFLPWNANEISSDKKRSPVDVSAAYLDYIRQIWNATVAKGVHNAQFERQDIVITVPASFDSSAQQLTLRAAEIAGYPKGVRLIEEPQAAFYAWLERHANSREQIVSTFPLLDEKPQILLVCDIGGGTSDFSLFEISLPPTSGFPPHIRRLAVSEHILLGGDNIDFTLARIAEERLGGLLEGSVGTLQRQQLVSQCRLLKERAMSQDIPANESIDDTITYTVSVSGYSSSLIGGTRSASLSLREIRDCIIGGFFGMCSADTLPDVRKEGLRELGLPYAKDPRVFAHLAGFLKKRRVDAVLLNGGTLTPHSLQQRVLEQLQSWQSEPICVFENNEPHLAVARGASWFQVQARASCGIHISGGSGHAVYIEVEQGKRKRKGEFADDNGQKQVICVLPQGTVADETIRITQLNLKLKVNNPIRFQAYESAVRPGDRSANVVPLRGNDFKALPLLQTIALLPPGTPPPEDGYIDVHLEASYNSIGIFQIACTSVRRFGDSQLRFDLEFNLRSTTNTLPEGSIGNNATAPFSPPDHCVSTESLQNVSTFLDDLYRSPQKSEQAGALLKELERLTGLSRKEWNTALLRELWVLLVTSLTKRSISTGHESGWITAAGFLLRPGYGYPFDEYRIRQLWFLEELGIAHPKDKNIREQAYILWRRTAGGLNREQQIRLFEQSAELIRSDVKASAEAIRMAGSFERLPLELKKELKDLLIRQVVAKSQTNRESQLWALGRLLSRIPLYGGQTAVTPPEWVIECYVTFVELDWSGSLKQGLINLFAQACRVVDQREYDVPRNYREQIIARLKQSGMNEARVEALAHYVPVVEKDIQSLFGESLPSGLRIG